MNRTFSLIVLFLAAILFGGAAPAGEPASRPLVVKVFDLPHPANKTVAARAERAVVEEFHRRFPHILLRSYSGITIEGMSLDSKALMAIAGGMAPDVMYVNFRMSDTYIRQGFLYPLDEFIREMSAEELRERVPAPAWPVIKRKGPDGQEHIWSLPHQMRVRALYYRKDLFQQAGLDPERPPKDWAELVEYSRRLTRPERGLYALLFAQGPAAAWDWIGFLWSAGGEAVVQNANGDWVAAFDSDAAVEAMLYFTRLQTAEWRDATGKVQRGYVCKDMDAARKWRDGKIAMRIDSLGAGEIAKGIDPEIVGIAPVPLGPTGKRGSELNCLMMGIFSDIQPRDGFSAAEIRRAAWEYIRFVDSDDARRIRARVFVEGGYGKLYNPILLAKYGYSEYLELVPKGWVEVFEEAVRSGKPEPYGKNCQAIYQYMTFPLDVCLQRDRAGTLGATDAERRQNIKQILTSAVARTNVEMIGAVSPEERRTRNTVAAFVGILLVAMLCYILYRVWKTFTPPETFEKGGWQLKRFYPAYLILLPAVLSILLWRYVPMFMGSVMAFQDYHIVGASKFVGLNNLADVLWDSTWWKTLWKTLYYMLLLLGLGFFTPIILAILLTECSRGKVFYRTLYYLPAVLSGMVVLYLWKLLYDPSDIGVLNQLLAKVGIEKQRWLDDERLAMLCCVIPTIWAGAGPKCLLYLAALKTIPDDLYEAADLDGCSFFKKVTHITLPSLKALIIINFIGEFIHASQNAHLILVMTFGGPAEATKVSGLYIFEKAYLLLQFGPAITMAWMLGILMLGFTTIQLKRLSQMEFKAAGRTQAANA